MMSWPVNFPVEAPDSGGEKTLPVAVLIRFS